MPEPVIYETTVDMNAPLLSERELTKQGETVYSLFIVFLAPGTTAFELNINGRWLTQLLQGDTIELGSCNPTERHILVRTAPVIAGAFSRVIIGATPDAVLVRP